MEVGQLTHLFLDHRSWINAQKVIVTALTPGVCTAGAVELFVKGMDQSTASPTSSWPGEEWGAVGHPYPLGSPAQSVGTLEDGLLELEVCAG
jgi:hypothetical protein